MTCQSKRPTPEAIDFVVQYLASYGHSIVTPEFIHTVQAAMQSMCDTAFAKISQQKKVIVGVELYDFHIKITVDVRCMDFTLLEKCLHPVHLKDLRMKGHAELNGYHIWALEGERGQGFTSTEFDIILIHAPWKAVYLHEGTFPMSMLWHHMIRHATQTSLRIWIHSNYCGKAMLEIGENVPDSRPIWGTEINRYDKQKVETTQWETDPYFLTHMHPLKNIHDVAD